MLEQVDNSRRNRTELTKVCQCLIQINVQNVHTYTQTTDNSNRANSLSLDVDKVYTVAT